MDPLLGYKQRIFFCWEVGKKEYITMIWEISLVVKGFFLLGSRKKGKG
jgi:hypothetical protein